MKNICVPGNRQYSRAVTTKSSPFRSLGSRTGLIPGSNRSLFARWLSTGVLSLPGTGGTRFPISGRRAVLSQPRGRRSPSLSPGHVLIFSFKPVRRVHLDFATIRWKFCASFLAVAVPLRHWPPLDAKDNVQYHKARVNHSTFLDIACTLLCKNRYWAKKIVSLQNLK